MDHHHTTALVTGASTGIGEQFARRLAAAGADLVLVARGQERLTALAASISATHPQTRVEVIAIDLARPGAGAEVGARIDALGLRIDTLVNNAGVGSHARFADEDLTALAAQIQLNVGALVDLTGRFLPGMLAARAGTIVNVASTAAFQPVPTMAVYGATKAFVLSFTEAIWGETRGSRIRVIALCPGPTETAFFATTGQEFLTAGRQTPQQVVDVAMRALDGRRPTVVSGMRNRLNSLGYRFLPRTTMIRLSGDLVRSAA